MTVLFFRNFLGCTIAKGIITLETNLIKYGLTKEFKELSEEYRDLKIARVTSQHHNLYQIVTENGFCPAEVSGKFQHKAERLIDFPAVGDWVMVSKTEDQAIIHCVLNRKSVLTRETAGTSKQGQIIASNIDVVFICMSLNDNFNVHRVERYLTLAWDSGALPVVVLTKADLCDDLSDKLHELEDVCLGVDIIVCSVESKQGYEDLLSFTTRNRTIAFVGSSGVGKSTLINWLVGKDILMTKEIRSTDSKGRHTTTSRELLILPNGGVVIDTPGMRELQIYVGDLSKTFTDIEQIAQKCKFRDCTHQNEPGCAVRHAIEQGELSKNRLDSYLKLQREMSYEDMNSRQLENDKIKRMFGGKKQMKQTRDHILKIKRR